MNAHQAPLITTPPARFRAARHALAVAAFVLLPLAAIGPGAAEAQSNGPTYKPVSDCVREICLPSILPLCVCIEYRR